MSVGVGSKYYSGFNPLDIGNCTLWLDGADRSTLTLSGSSVTTWADKSGNGYNATQGTSARQPTAVSTGVSFTAANSNFMSMNVPFSQNHSFFIVTTMSTTGTYLMNRSGALGGGPAVLLYSNRIRYIDVTDDADFLSSSTLPGRVLISYTRTQSTSVVGYLNGTQRFSITQAYSTTPSIPYNFLGCTDGTANFYDGILSEFIYFSSVVDSAQRQQLEGYLAWKWGITSTIPTTHPYYSIYPVTRPFSPLDLPGCMIWIDAADPSTMTLSGSNITAIVDKSPAANTMTVSATRPIYNSNAQGGRGRIEFSGTSFFQSTSASVPLANRCAFFVVEQNPSTAITANAEGILSIGGSATVVDWSNVNAMIYAGRASNAFQNSSFSAAANNADYMVNYGIFTVPTPFGLYVDSFTSPSGTMFVNGSSNASDTVGTTPGTGVGFLIGARLQGSATPSVLFNGFIHEIIYYSNALSATQRQQVEGYLSRKWGLTNIGTQLTLGFTPTLVANCALWLDSADSTSITLSGSSVTQWSDKSGNSRNFTQTVASNQPTFSGGSNGISFVGNGTTASTQFLDNSSIPISNAGYSIFAVARGGSTRSSSTGYNYVLKGNLASDGFLFVGNHSSKNFATFTGTASWNDVGSNSPAIPTTNNTLLMEAIISNTVLTPYYNGNLMATKTGTTGAFSGMRIGDATPSLNVGQTWNGNIYEIVIYNAVVTEADRKRIEVYLARKWNVPLTIDLPSTHPFRNRLPAITSFNPRQFSNCGLWLDAADPSTLTLSGSNVTQWRDKGSGLVFSNSGTVTYSSVSNAINFTGSNILTNSTGISTSIAVNQFIVWSSSVGGTRQRLVQQTFSNQHAFGIIDTTYMQNIYNSTVGYFVGPLSYLTDTMYIYSVNTRSASSLSYSVTGTESSSWTSPWNPGVQPTTLFVGGTSSFPFTGSIMEVIQYDTFLTQAQTRQIEGYLAWKWRLQGASSSSLTTFIPTQISGCALWLDGADSSTLTLSGSNVTTWADKSGNGRNATQSTASNRPTYLNNYVNFSTSNVLNLPNGTLPSGSTATTMFMVASVTNTSNVQYLFGAGSAVNNQGFNVYTETNTLNLDVFGTRARGGFTSTTTSILGFTFGSSTLTIHVNGTSIASQGAVTKNTGTLNNSIGASSGSSGGLPFFMTGSIGEILIYPSALSTVARQQVEGYLASKWGISPRGLPITHPFKTISPI